MQKELGAVTSEVNVALIEALRPLLDADGVLDPKDIRAAAQRVRMTLPTVGNADEIAVQNLGKIEKFNRREVYRTIGIEVPEFSAAIGATWRREQVALIKSLSSGPKAKFLKYFDEAQKKGTRVETIRNWLTEQLGVNERRARLIARDQVLSLNAKLTKDRHQQAGITEYVWRSLGDDSEREHHADLDGQRFKYSDPPMGGGTGPDDRGHPGEGIGCRCQAVPVIPEFE